MISIESAEEVSASVQLMPTVQTLTVLSIESAEEVSADMELVE